MVVDDNMTDSHALHKSAIYETEEVLLAGCHVGNAANLEGKKKISFLRGE